MLPVRPRSPAFDWILRRVTARRACAECASGAASRTAPDHSKSRATRRCLRPIAATGPAVEALLRSLDLHEHIHFLAHGVLGPQLDRLGRGKRRLEFRHVGVFPDDRDLVGLDVAKDAALRAEVLEGLRSLRGALQPAIHVSNAMHGDHPWHGKLPVGDGPARSVHHASPAPRGGPMPPGGRNNGRLQLRAR